MPYLYSRVRRRSCCCRYCCDILSAQQCLYVSSVFLSSLIFFRRSLCVRLALVTNAHPRKIHSPTPSSVFALSSVLPSADVTPAPTDAGETPAPAADATPAPDAEATPAPTTATTPSPVAGGFPVGYRFYADGHTPSPGAVHGRLFGFFRGQGGA